MYRINRCIPSSLDNANRGITDILRIIDKVVCEDTLYDIRFILNELVVNSVEHGNKNDINKKIDIEVGITDGDVKIRVRDQGDGICYDETGINCLAMTPDGRGLFIVKRLADDVLIDENEITCILKGADPS